MRFEYGTETIEFTVEYRKRKSLRISVEPPDSVFVVAPVGIKDDEILKIVKSKAKWIEKKLSEIKESRFEKRDRKYASGEIFMYLGHEYRLKVQMDVSAKKPSVEFEGGYFHMITGTEDIAVLGKAMEDWYREKSLDIVTERVRHYQRHFVQRPIEIKAKKQRKRWGSCSNAHRLNFNLRCAMAPMDVIDYIVVHEMCHMVQFNHSKEFWGVVEKIMPDYKDRREWLRKNGIRMIL
ncbi:MAG: M48 family metallopeptidase [Peptostreptococcaceae bacterium]|nr:M48 family metallopeptidase [Peptostreptococcaceae bacterium]